MSDGRGGQAYETQTESQLAGTPPTLAAGGPNVGAPTSVRAAPLTGRGFSQDEIRIGLATIKDQDAAFESIGVQSSIGDQEGIQRAVIDDVNRRGGIAGRKVVPVFHDIKSADVIRDRNQATEAACRYWTEDHQVFAVVNGVTLSDRAMAACLAKHQTPLIFVGQGVLRPRSIFSEFDPYLYAPFWPTMESLVRAEVERGVALQYFRNWDAAQGKSGVAPVKIGVLTMCCNLIYGRDFGNNMRHELRRVNHDVAATFEMSENADHIPTDANAAVLRFREAGVTHVITSNALALLFFGLAAEQQRYRPRYLMTSNDTPEFMQANLPPGQLNGAVGIGFIPTLDVDNAHDPGDPSPARARCRDIMRRSGQDISSRLAADRAFVACDGFDFLVAALASGDLSALGLRKGATELANLPASSTFQISLNAEQPFAGARAGRDLAFRAECRCFTYLNQQNHAL